MDRHHIYNQGIRNSRGCDCPDNIIMLSRLDHIAVHALGRQTWFRRKGLMDVLDRATSHHYARNQGETECSKKLKSANKRGII